MSAVAVEYPIFNGLPTDIPALQELMSRRQWVAWRYLERDGDITKPPVNPHNGYGASHSDSATWGTYEQAARWAIEHGLPGVGYVMTDDDDLTGADLDKCRDDGFGGIDDWANEIVNLAETYTEISPSGRGLRLIWRGKIDKTIKCDPAHVEVYRSKRFLTITGDHLSGTPTTIRPAPQTEAVLRQRAATFRPTPAAPLPKKGGIISTALAQLSPGSGGGFFRTVNSMALERLSVWVPDVFGPLAEFQPGTGAWRVSSKNLGRNLQEDLSIAPNGIVDFGVHDMGDPRLGKRTPIDLALEYGSHRTATEAAQWLCGKMGVDANSIGWRTGEASNSPKQSYEEAAVSAPAEDIFEFLDIPAIKALPDARWVVRDVIVEDGLGFIYGPPGHGKTFVALSLALTIAYKLPEWWWGKQINRNGLVIYIAREGVAGLKTRIEAWQRQHGIAEDNAAFVLIRSGINFMAEEDIGRLLRTINAAAAALNAEPTLIFVDTVSRVMPGADENLQKEMTIFVAACDALRDRFKATVVGVHHAGKSGDMRGSTVLKGAGDFVFKVEKEDEMDHRSGIKFHAEKIKDSEDGWSKAIELKAVNWMADGEIDAERKSLVALPVAEDKQPAKQGKGWPDRDTCNRILAAIEQAWVNGRPWSHSPQSPDRYGPLIMVEQFGLKVKTAQEVLKKWLVNDILLIEVRDSHTKAKGLKVLSYID